MIVVQKPSGMPGEQEHHISSVPFFFFITYKILTCERALISATSQPKKAPQNLLLYGKLISGLTAQDGDIAF